MTLKELASLVRTVREAQKAYDREGLNSEAVTVAEKTLDDAVNEILEEKIREQMS